jgi:hypothetical protein
MDQRRIQIPVLKPTSTHEPHHQPVEPETLIEEDKPFLTPIASRTNGLPEPESRKMKLPATPHTDKRTPQPAKNISKQGHTNENVNNSG